MVTHRPSRTHDAGTPESAAFRAIADPTRRAILDRLRSGGMAAGEIARRFDMSRPAVSKHLRVLAEASLVRVERSGRSRLYALNPAPLARVDAWLSRYRVMWMSGASEASKGRIWV